MTTLTEIVCELEPVFVASLSAIRIEMADGEAVAVLNCALFTDQVPDYVRAADLPPGVGLTARVRWPDQRRPLSMDVPIDQQIRDLHASGLVGSLDAARFQEVSGGRRAIRWLVKTHAGSDAERFAWLKSLSAAGYGCR